MNARSPAPSPLFAIRPGREGDWPFVVDSLALSDAHSPRGRDAGGGRQGTAYAEHARGRVLALVQRAEVSVAHVLDDDDAVYGYLVAEPPDVVHYVYVRRDARRLGVARALLADYIGREGRVEFTHRPVVPWNAVAQIPASWRYNPYRGEP